MAARSAARKKSGKKASRSRTRPRTTRSRTPEAAPATQREEARPEKLPSRGGGSGGGGNRKAALQRGGLQQKWERLVAYLKAVRAEVKRVSWPTKEELIAGTIVCLIVLLVISAYLGVVDWLLSLIFGQKATGF